MVRKISIILLVLVIPMQLLTAQEKSKKRVKLTGYITDSYKNPITEVLFMVDDIKVDPIFNGKGSYRYRIKPTSKKITVLHYTLGTIEKEYNGSDTINFVFPGSVVPGVGSDLTVDEVIDIGYSNVRERDLNADVSAIKNNDIMSTKYSNIYDMIKGELMGVIVNGTSIRIQGISSINSSNEPLILVNGMATSSVANINPRDVKSISLIRGPAASIYGSRGANGVIDIKLR